jgi:hydroxypyruvate reductase
VPRSSNRLRRDALTIFQAALEAADAARAVRGHLSIRAGQLKAGSAHLPLKSFDRMFLLAVGKAAAQMAVEIERIAGKHLAGGLAITKHGHAAVRPRHLPVIEAGHPIPDDAGAKAAGTVRELLRELNARDLLIVAISGGASALLSAPAEPVTLAAKQKTTDLLLRAGADIFELNAVRKHLSTLKGGWLSALAYPANVVSLLLSDVIGDPLDVIGSGPTAPDESTFADATGVLEKYRLLDRVPAAVRERLERGLRGEIPETPKPGDPLFQNVYNVVVGSNGLALEAAAGRARLIGYRPLILSSSIQGETREVARVHAEILREVVMSGHPLRAPACILSGGETTVTVRGSGKGGRNQEFALAVALAIAGLPNVLALSGGTDGTDGPTDAAGAMATGETVALAKKRGLDALDHLARNDAYPFFAALGDLVKTGPTGTNVMDLNLLLAGKS